MRECQLTGSTNKWQRYVEVAAIKGNKWNVCVTFDSDVLFLVSYFIGVGVPITEENNQTNKNC